MAEKLLNIDKIKRLRRPVVICLVFIVIVVMYFPNYAKMKKLRQENRRISEEIDRLSIEIADYKDKLSKRGNDPYLYERIARDDLGIARENEIIIDIEQ